MENRESASTPTNNNNMNPVIGLQNEGNNSSESQSSLPLSQLLSQSELNNNNNNSNSNENRSSNMYPSSLMSFPSASEPEPHNESVASSGMSEEQEESKGDEDINNVQLERQFESFQGELLEPGIISEPVHHVQASFLDNAYNLSVESALTGDVSIFSTENNDSINENITEINTALQSTISPPLSVPIPSSETLFPSQTQKVNPSQGQMQRAGNSGDKINTSNDPSKSIQEGTNLGKKVEDVKGNPPIQSQSPISLDKWPLFNEISGDKPKETSMPTVHAEKKATDQVSSQPVQGTNLNLVNGNDKASMANSTKNDQKMDIPLKQLSSNNNENNNSSSSIKVTSIGEGQAPSKIVNDTSIERKVVNVNEKATTQIQTNNKVVASTSPPSKVEVEKNKEKEPKKVEKKEKKETKKPQKQMSSSSISANSSITSQQNNTINNTMQPSINLSGFQQGTNLPPNFNPMAFPGFPNIMNSNGINVNLNSNNLNGINNIQMNQTLQNAIKQGMNLNNMHILPPNAFKAVVPSSSIAPSNSNNNQSSSNVIPNQLRPSIIDVERDQPVKIEKIPKVPLKRQRPCALTNPDLNLFPAPEAPDDEMLNNFIQSQQRKSSSPGTPTNPTQGKNEYSILLFPNENKDSTYKGDEVRDSKCPVSGINKNSVLANNFTLGPRKKLQKKDDKQLKLRFPYAQSIDDLISEFKQMNDNYFKKLYNEKKENNDENRKKNKDGPLLSPYMLSVMENIHPHLYADLLAELDAEICSSDAVAQTKTRIIADVNIPSLLEQVKYTAIYNAGLPDNVVASSKIDVTKDEIIPIRIHIETDGFRLIDSFTYNVNDPYMTPELMANIMCQDLNLPVGIGLLISKSIHEQIYGYRQQQISKMKIGIIPICLRVKVGNYIYFDTFEYDTDNQFNSPEVLASITVAELGLPPDLGPIITTSILEQIIHTKQIYYYAYMKAVQQILNPKDDIKSSGVENDEKSTSGSSKKRKFNNVNSSDTDVKFLQFIGDINEDDKMLASTRQYSHFSFNGIKNIWELQNIQAPIVEKKKDGRGRPKKDATLQREREQREREEKEKMEQAQRQMQMMMAGSVNNDKNSIIEKFKVEEALNYDGNLRETRKEKNSLVKSLDYPENGRFIRAKGEVLDWGPRITHLTPQSHTCSTLDMINLLRPTYSK